MSSENVEVVRRVYDAVFVQRDVAATMGGSESLVHADAEADWSSSVGPHQGVYRWQEGIETLWGSFTEAWDEWSTQPEDFIDAGDQVVVVNLLRARGKASGVEVAARGAQVWTVRDGKVAAVKLYQDKDEALEAVGLRE